MGWRDLILVLTGSLGLLCVNRGWRVTRATSQEALSVSQVSNKVARSRVEAVNVERRGRILDPLCKRGIWDSHETQVGDDSG